MDAVEVPKACHATMSLGTRHHAESPRKRKAWKQAMAGQVAQGPQLL